MSIDEQAATLDHEGIVELLTSHQQLASSHDELATSHNELATSHDKLTARNVELSRQLDWFKRQLFGARSERRLVDPDGRQLALGEWQQKDEPGKPITVAGHRRRSSTRHDEPTVEGALRFDESVPVEEIRFPAPELDDDHEVVSEKETCRLAQRPASYVVLKYIRPVVKRKSDGKLFCPPAPASVLGKSVADVSLLACMVIDKFRYHLPLYRQHQRLAAAGVRLARSTLTGLMQRTADLLQPIYEAQLYSVVNGDVVTMDETPIKAGRKRQGKMKTGYFWPIYGDQDEVVFPFSASRSGEMLRKTLGEYCGVLVSDGYSAYEKYASQVNGVVHAQCWSHTRRTFLKAEDIEPELTETALTYIRQLYDEEEQLRRKPLDDIKKAERRAQHCKPIVDEFFEWLKDIVQKRILLPSNPFAKAVGYALDREISLRVFLEYPGVPIDTNHLEREIRPIALGRKNWMFCWTEIGAQDVGVFQTLLSTCRLQDVDPYTYLVDVLQRVEVHPASEVATLTPRLWKKHFAAEPLRSDIDREVKNTGS